MIPMNDEDVQEIRDLVTEQKAQHAQKQITLGRMKELAECTTTPVNGPEAAFLKMIADRARTKERHERLGLLPE